MDRENIFPAVSQIPSVHIETAVFILIRFLKLQSATQLLNTEQLSEQLASPPVSHSNKRNDENTSCDVRVGRLYKCRAG